MFLSANNNGTVNRKRHDRDNMQRTMCNWIFIKSWVCTTTTIQRRTESSHSLVLFIVRCCRLVKCVAVSCPLCMDVCVINNRNLKNNFYSFAVWRGLANSLIQRHALSLTSFYSNFQRWWPFCILQYECLSKWDFFCPKPQRDARLRLKYYDDIMGNDEFCSL